MLKKEDSPYIYNIEIIALNAAQTTSGTRSL